MAGSSDGSEEEVPAPYSQDPLWADVAPIISTEVAGAAPVVAIQYQPRHREALSYFRAVLLSGERSQRVLNLTADLIGFNSADYTAWEVRWQCLQQPGVDMQQEYAFTEGIMEDNAKNYQLWNHRRKCARALGAQAAERELQVAAQALEVDEKNYHAWAHRQAVIEEFGDQATWAQELLYCDSMLQKDVRNNSAWNQRAFIIRLQLQAAQGVPSTSNADMDPVLKHVLLHELEYAAAHAIRAPRNESVWNYVMGLFKLPGVPPHAMGRFEMIHTLCREALMDAPSCPPALDLLSAYYTHVACLAAQQLRHLTAAGSGASGPTAQAAATSSNASAMQGVTPGTGAAGAAAGAPAAQTAAVPQPGAAAGPELRQAQEAVMVSARTALILLNHLTISDPVRTMYWGHRQQDVEALLLSLGLELGGLGGPPPPPADAPVAPPQAQVPPAQPIAAAGGGQPMVL